jgi:tripartite-type tricarboxylate transporter receptor subunit TctC
MVRALRFALLFAFIAHLAPAAAQPYPSRPVRMVVPYAAGGAADALARPMAKALSAQLGQPVLVDNRPGATGMVAGEIVARAPADGYTIKLNILALYMARYFAKSVPYDPYTDFTPIGIVAAAPIVLAVHTSIPASTVSELVDYAKRNPGKLYYGTTGIGSTQHLAGVELARVTGASFEHVPYKGGNPAMADVLAGQIPMVILTASTVMPQVRAGRLRALGLIENRRFSGVPGVPTIGESVPGFSMPDTWYGLFGPGNLPPPIVERLNTEMRKAVASPEVRNVIEGIGFEVTPTSPAEHAARVKVEVEQVSRLMQAAGIKPE